MDHSHSTSQHPIRRVNILHMRNELLIQIRLKDNYSIRNCP